MKLKTPIGIIVPLALITLLACGGSQQSVTQDIESTETGSEGVLQIHFLDVGQGDSIVIVTPNERVVMIDAGTRQAGSDIVQFLNEMGIYRLNLAIITHAHADHIGGFIRVFDATDVLRYGDPGFLHASSMYANLLERVEAEGSEVFWLEVGQRIRIDEGIEMRVLAPPYPHYTGTRSDANSNSVVLLLEYGDFTALLTGDSEAETERDIVRQHLVGDLDVLKVAHHGGAHSSIQPFLDITQPEIAIISCGAGNSYGHPAPGTVERLQRFATDGIYRTDLDGTITVETNGDWIHVFTERTPHQVGLLLQMAALVQ